jgi:hypothetical protein
VPVPVRLLWFESWEGGNRIAFPTVVSGPMRPLAPATEMS